MNGQKEQQEVSIEEKSDMSLSIVPFVNERKVLEEITINVDEYHTTIKQVLYS